MDRHKSRRIRCRLKGLVVKIRRLNELFANKKKPKALQTLRDYRLNTNRMSSKVLGGSFILSRLGGVTVRLVIVLLTVKYAATVLC